MKLSQVNYEADTAKEVEITDHNGKSFEPKAIINVVSWKSKVGSKAIIEMHREMIEHNANKKEDEDIEEKIKESLINGMSKLIVGWSGIEDEKGKPLKFNDENVKSVLKNKYIFDAIDSFSSNLGNFRG